MEYREARHVLGSLPSGRHYAGSADGQCWTMVGRDLRDVDEWSIVPPAASLTLAWGEGGCALSFEGGGFEMRSGGWMWIDAGFAHRGRNVPGSDFLTVFFSESLVRAACLDLAPIGAGTQPSPPPLARMLVALSARMLTGTDTDAVSVPARAALLDWVGGEFAPGRGAGTVDPALAAGVAALRAEPLGERPIAEVARAAGLSGPEFSRRFSRRYRLTPVAYRKQLRLVVATRALAAHGSVTRAAHAAGFADAAHLSRTFREQYGISPSDWVRRVVRA